MNQNELEELIVQVAKLRDGGMSTTEAIEQVAQDEATREILTKAINE